LEVSMSDWTAGYVADVGYTFGYYTELNLCASVCKAYEKVHGRKAHEPVK